MKIAIKLLKIGFGMISFILLFLVVTNHFWPQMYHEELNPIFTTSVSGRSMDPTLTDGQKININSAIIPAKGDVVAFRCFTEKCMNGDSFDFKVKRLTNVDQNGCFYFEGDNPDHSWDSRNYGSLCGPNDVKILGVVIQ